MSRVAKKAARYFRKVATLQAMGQDGRDELRRMRDVRDYRDSTGTKPSPGELWNPNGKRLAKGTGNKAKSIRSTIDAIARQGL